MLKSQVILVVDDDKNTRDGIQLALSSSYTVLTAESSERAISILDAQTVNLILTDLRMPGDDGLTLLKSVTKKYPQIPVILLTAYGSVETAVNAMKEGASDFLTKPINLDHLELIVSKTLHQQHLEAENRKLQEQLDSHFGLENIIGSSDAMRHVFDVIKQAAPTHATILIQGASGTGKELVANAIHRLSQRSKAPFIPVHCAALSSSLLESELFGHEKGAFTGAVEMHKGRFELANGGTLFLDEISEIDIATQVKLLRVLESRKIERVGGSQAIPVDIRLITATNRNLREWVKEGKFREDLYFRLNVVDINLPSLTERIGDLPLLVNKFIREFSEENGKKINGISSDAMKLLTGYDFPGNVRELRNIIEKMVVLTHNDILSVEDLPDSVTESKSSTPQIPSTPKFLTASTILETLKSCPNKTQAAELLGISRRTLYRKLDELTARGLYHEEESK